MNVKKSLIFLCLGGMCFSSLAQEKATQKTDVNTDVDVTVVYEQVIKEGYGTPFIYKELANAYYFKNNHALAKEWFEKLFETEALTDQTLRFRYRQTLKALNLEIVTNQYLSALDKSN